MSDPCFAVHVVHLAALALPVRGFVWKNAESPTKATLEEEGDPKSPIEMSKISAPTVAVD